jgi:hypothetical protein
LAKVSEKSTKRVFGWWRWFLVLAISGCGGSERVDVTGRVTRKDGSPVVGAVITFRSPTTGERASGITDSDGHYELGTFTPGEGILPGDYEVTVMEDRGPVTSPRPRTIHPGYETAQTSTLRFTVERGGERQYDIVLLPP